MGSRTCPGRGLLSWGRGPGGGCRILLWQGEAYKGEGMAKLVNLTPHPITIVVGDQKLVLAPSGQVARVGQGYRDLGTLDFGDVAVPVVATTYGDIVGLPPEQPGTFYIASILVAQVAWAMGRLDVLAPDTGAGAVRDEQGRVVGVTRLIASPDFRLLY